MLYLHKHNKETYQNLINIFEKHNRAAVVQPTGTGKSFIILKLIKDNPRRQFVVLSPSVYIQYQLETHADTANVKLDNVQFITYPRLSFMQKYEMEEIYCDYIILDEFHRCGSSEWGRGVTDFLAIHSNAKIMGTSATPIRYMDFGRNMAEELFESNYAVNMSLSEAIRQHILPLPVYVTGWYSFRGQLEEFSIRAEQSGNPILKELMNTKIREARRMIADLDCGLDKVFAKHIPNRCGKYIVFCPNVESIGKMMKDSDDWFSLVNADLHKYSVYSAKSDPDRDFNNFRNDTDEGVLKLLFCVDMLNEGVHIDDVDGVIMLRATQSANIFYQQIGRALACSEKRKHPVIFDLVNNYETGDTASEYAKIVQYTYTRHNRPKNVPEFKIYDYVRDIRAILDELNNTFALSFDHAFELLCEFKENHGRFPLYSENYGGMQLGKWAASMRRQRNSNVLAEWKIEKLDAIGFGWTVIDQKWYIKYNELKSVVDKLGHFPYGSEYGDRSLMLWVYSQKKKYKEGNLDEDKRQMLLDLGVDVSVIYDPWREKYEWLEKVVKRLGHFPSNKELSEDEQPLKRWLYLQKNRYKQGRLSKKLADKLITLGMESDTSSLCKADLSENINMYGETSVKKQIRYDEAFEKEKTGSRSNCEETKGKKDVPGNLTKRELSWRRKYAKLVEFVNKNDRFPGYTDPEEKSLSIWVQTQRAYFKAGKLTDEQIKLLEEINFSFAGFDDLWQKQYLLVKEYIEKTGEPLLQKTIYKDAEIGAWFNKQIRELNKGKLRSDRAELIKQLGINTSGGKYKREQKWLEFYNTYVEYLETFGEKPNSKERYKGLDLYKWSYAQVDLIRSNKSTAEHTEMLKEIGITADGR